MKNRRNGLSQVDFLKLHFAAGHSITRLEALHYGLQNLTARIADLRKAGINVVCEWRKDAVGADYGRFSTDRRAA